MPSHGADIIDGIPVILRGSQMFAFQPGQSPSVAKIQLGTYDSATKKAIWTPSDEISKWLTHYQESLVSRSRK